MTRIAVSLPIEAPHQRVWSELSDLASHAEWMKDAVSIVFTSPQTAGVGTVMEVETRVGPLRTTDVMEVVGWDEGRSIEVVHIGLVRGRGVLSSVRTDTGAAVTWVEDLVFPWWLGGPITAWLARPVLRAIWLGNLRRLATRVSSL